jgi:hypothetical protein
VQVVYVGVAEFVDVDSLVDVDLDADGLVYV